MAASLMRYLAPWPLHGNYFRTLNMTCNHFLNNHIFAATLRRVAVRAEEIIVQPTRFASGCRFMQLRNTFAMTVGARDGRRVKTLRNGIYSVVAFAAACLSGGAAYAVSDNVKHACRDDYFQHCSQYAVGSDELRQCMRKVGEDLSTPCLVALVQEGEITKADVDRHNAAKSTVTKSASTKKTSQQVAAEDTGDPKDVSAKTAKTSKATNKKKKPKATTKDEGSASATDDPSKGEAKATKSAKASKSDKTGTAAKSTKKSGKKKAKKAKSAAAGAASTDAAAAPAAGTATPKAKKSTATTTAKSGKKKKSGSETATKAKKTSKKKTSGAAAKKPLDGQTP